MKRSLAIAALLLSGCVTLPPLNERQVAAATERWPDVDAQALHEGQRMYRVRCSACHNLYAPQTLAARGWDELSAEMVDRAKLSPEDREKVFRYLWAATVDAKND